MGWFKKILVAIGITEQNISFLHQTKEIRQFIVGLVLWGGGMGLIASFTDWMNQFSPFSWAVGGALGVLLYMLILAISAKYALWSAQKELAIRRTIVSTSFNPMDGVIQNERIKVQDLAHPIERDVKDKTLVGCELYGPAVVFLAGGNYNQCNYSDCDMHKLNSGFQIKNAITFIDVNLQNCRFFNVTILVPPAHAGLIEAIPGFGGWASG